MALGYFGVALGNLGVARRILGVAPTVGDKVVTLKVGEKGASHLISLQPTPVFKSFF